MPSKGISKRTLFKVVRIFKRIYAYNIDLPNFNFSINIPQIEAMSIL